jgi:hypothetical protein
MRVPRQRAESDRLLQRAAVAVCFRPDQLNARTQNRAHTSEGAGLSLEPHGSYPEVDQLRALRTEDVQPQP